MNRMIKRGMAAVLSLMLALSLAACGQDSKQSKEEFRTPGLLEEINGKKGIHMDFSLDEGEDADVRMKLYRKDDDIYVEYDEAEEHVIVITDGEQVSVLDPAQKVAVQTELDDDVRDQIKDLTEDTDKIFDLSGDDQEWKKSTAKQEGMEYESEEAEKDGVTVKFLYNDDGDLAYIIVEDDGEESAMKVKAFDSEIPDDIFEIPASYTVRGDKTPERMPTPSGKYEVYTIRSGYTFEYDTAYMLDEVGNTTHVYTYGEKGVPYFWLFLMQNSTGMTAQEMLSGVAKEKIKSLGDKLVTGPVTNTFDAGDRKIDGIEWIYKSDDGTKEYIGVQYTEVIGTYFFHWNAIYEPGDTETPKALEHAMKTFKMLAT